MLNMWSEVTEKVWHEGCYDILDVSVFDHAVLVVVVVLVIVVVVVVVVIGHVRSSS